MPHKIRPEDNIVWKCTNLSLIRSASGEWGVGIIDISPELVLAIQIYILKLNYKVYI